MSELVTWEPPEIVTRHGRRPDFAEDPRFTAQWWGQNGGFTPPDYEWRSYRRDDEEIARALLSLKLLYPVTNRGAPSVPTSGANAYPRFGRATKSPMPGGDLV